MEAQKDEVADAVMGDISPDIELKILEIQEILKRDSVSDRPYRSTYFNYLSVVLESRFRETGSIKDLDASINAKRDAIESIQNNPLERSVLLRELGESLQRRYLKTYSSNDILDAVTVAKDGLELTPKQHPGRVDHLLSLASALKLRFEATRSTKDIDDSIDSLHHALQIPKDSWDRRSVVLDHLGSALHLRFEKMNSMEDLDSLVQTRENALEITTDNGQRAFRLINLASARLYRYGKKRMQSDLDVALTANQTALESLSKDDPKRIICLANLGICLDALYLQTGSLKDLNAGINSYNEALKLSSNQDYERNMIERKLAQALWNRFEFTGSLGDLTTSIDILQQALNRGFMNDVQRRSCLNDLGIAFARRAERHGDLTDLDSAIAAFEESVTELSEVPNTTRAVRLNNLAGALGRRFEWLGSRIEDSDAAIRSVEEAIRITPETHMERAAYFSNLGKHFHVRYEKQRRLEDLQKSIQYRRHAIEAASMTKSSQTMYFKALGETLYDLFEQTNSNNDLKASIDSYREGFACRLSPPTARIHSAVIGARLAGIIYPQEALSMLKKAVEMLPIASPRTLRRSDQQYTLSNFAGMASDAAALSLRCGEDVSEALRLLELGRGVMISMLLETRTDITDLAVKQPDLASKFSKLRDQLDSSAIGDKNLSNAYERGIFLSRTADVYEAAEEFNNVVTQIREIEDFQNFLLGPTTDELRNLARAGPLIYLNHSRYGSDAFLITRSGIKHLPLTNLEPGDLERHTSTLDRVLGNDSLATRSRNIRAMREVLEWLWDVIVEPILTELGFTTSPGTVKEWPHVWWIPVGRLSKFPLHAAGYHSKDGRNTLDRVISSYTPTIRALVYSRNHQERVVDDQKILMTVMPMTPKQCALPFSEQEIKAIDSALPERVQRIILQSPNKADVLEDIHKCSIIHFSCHGAIDADPSKSRILFMDWETNPFSVGDMAALKLGEVRLAYLSACHAANSRDEELLDEAFIWLERVN